MAHRIPFLDDATTRDVLTFAQRAARIPNQGLRMTASGGVMALQLAVSAPQGLLDTTPLIIGMRTARVDPELICDFVIDPAGITAAGETELELPGTASSPSWAAVSPPRSGWQPAGDIASDALDRADDLPEGVVSAARALGFLGEPERARRFARGPWRRITLKRGHLLFR